MDRWTQTRLFAIPTFKTASIVIAKKYGTNRNAHHQIKKMWCIAVIHCVTFLFNSFGVSVLREPHDG